MSMSVELAFTSPQVCCTMGLHSQMNLCWTIFATAKRYVWVFIKERRSYTPILTKRSFFILSPTRFLAAFLVNDDDTVYQ